VAEAAPDLPAAEEARAPGKGAPTAPGGGGPGPLQYPRFPQAQEDDLLATDPAEAGLHGWPQGVARPALTGSAVSPHGRCDWPLLVAGRPPRVARASP
jgi:hypothetical protein